MITIYCYHKAKGKGYNIVKCVFPAGQFSKRTEIITDRVPKLSDAARIVGVLNGCK